MSKIWKKIWNKTRQLSSSSNDEGLDIIEICLRSYPHIAKHIFSFLDIKSLNQCGLVCRQWKDLSESIKMKRIEFNWRNVKYSQTRMTVFEIGEPVQEIRSAKCVGNEIYFFLNDTLRIFHASSFKKLYDLTLPPGSCYFDVKGNTLCIACYVVNELSVIVFDRKSRKKLHTYTFSGIETEEDSVEIGYHDAVYVIDNGVVACKDGSKYLIIDFPKPALSSLSTLIVNIKLYLTTDNESIVCFRSPRRRYGLGFNDLNIGLDEASTATIFVYSKPLEIRPGVFEPCKLRSLLTPFNHYLQNVALTLDSWNATLICVGWDSQKMCKKKLSVRKLNLKTGEMAILSPTIHFSPRKIVRKGFYVGSNLIVFELFDEMFEEAPEVRILPIGEGKTETGCSCHIDDESAVFRLNQTSYGYDQFYIKYFDIWRVIAQRDKIFRDNFVQIYDISIP